MAPSPRLIAMKEVLHRVAISKTEIYRRIKAGNFPQQVQLGPSRIAFVEAEIDQWIIAHSSSRQGAVDAQAS